jgi:hypothetical protein
MIVSSGRDHADLRLSMEAERGAHLRGGRQAAGLTAVAAGEAAWFGWSAL